MDRPWRIPEQSRRKKQQVWGLRLNREAVEPQEMGREQRGTLQAFWGEGTHTHTRIPVLVMMVSTPVHLIHTCDQFRKKDERSHSQPQEPLCTPHTPPLVMPQAELSPVPLTHPAVLVEPALCLLALGHHQIRVVSCRHEE